MSITLDALTLPEDLIWQDEFDWTAIQQSSEFSLSGALIIQESTKLAGRPITLTGGQNYGLATRDLINALTDKIQSSSVMLLVLNDAREFYVRFRHTEKPVDAKPIIDYSLPDDADLYTLMLRLMEVSYG